MGYDTQFYGRLEFNRRLNPEESVWLSKALNAGRFDIDALESDGVPPDEAKLLLYAPVVGPGMSPANAGDLRITSDGEGLEYRSEKSYEMVEGVNFIIANVRLKIPDFGLKGSLFASTEFEPYNWLLKIGEDGWAHQEPCRMTELRRHDLRAYVRHVRWNWRKPSVW